MNRTDQAILAAMIVGAGAIGVGIFLQVVKGQKDLTARVSGLGRKGVRILEENVTRDTRPPVSKPTLRPRGELRDDEEEALPA